MLTHQIHRVAWSMACALCFAAGVARADTPAQAIASAEHTIAAHGFSASRLRALGDAQLEQGQLGSAIASFERGLLLSPRDAALRGRLSQAREKAGLAPPEPASIAARIAYALSLREWAFGAFASALGVSFALVGLSVTRRSRVWLRGLLAIALLAGAGSLAGVVTMRAELQRAYVLRDDSAVRQSPFEAASVLTNLHAGEAVREHSVHAGFVYVETEQGVYGWMAQAELAPLAVTPAAPTS
jgi:hypothetical protein